MAKLNLSKEAATVLKLSKAVTGTDAGLKMQVKLLQDVSGSMNDEFENGLMESVLQRVIAFSSVIDPDGKVETVAFSHTAHHMGELDISAFNNATKVFLEGAKPVLWGGTNYSTAFSLVNSESAEPSRELLVEEKPGLFGKVMGMFGKAKAEPVVVAAPVVDETEYPNLIIFITDGEDAGNKAAFHRELAKTISDNKTFVLLLGAGNAPVDFSRLEEADELFEGVDFVSANGIKDLDNDDFYTKLITPELQRFMKRWSERAVA